MPDRPLDVLELELHLLAQLQIERPERLVEQQHARPVDQGACERHALALAAGQRSGLAAPRSASRTISSASAARVRRSARARA